MTRSLRDLLEEKKNLIREIGEAQRDRDYDRVTELKEELHEVLEEIDWKRNDT